MVFYPRASEESLDPDLFENPSAEYRGVPFWAWNGVLDRNLLSEQIGMFGEMGFGGFLIHSRTGLEAEYLGKDFLGAVDFCRREAEKRGMKCWLYDEDRYPSGTAGGLVTEDRSLRVRHILFSPVPVEELHRSREDFLREEAGGLCPGGYFLSAYRILRSEGFLLDWTRFGDGESGEGDLWYAYVRLAGESPWYNGNTYADLMNHRAVDRFIQVTHDVYAKTLGREFGRSVPAVFTDEPQLQGKGFLPFSHRDEAVTFAFTEDFPDSYRQAWGEDFLDRLPELFWERREGKSALFRYRVHRHMTERFARAYSDRIGTWCEEHRIALTGHLMSEHTLFAQTYRLGEAMRHYRKFELPGVDILCDHREFDTVKQAASVSRQYGREGVLSELYGATHWHFPFAGHKLQGDWQAALGVTVRVPHLFFMSMAGESKRDWPASIGYQSPWYEEYPLVENHFARLNTALTRGEARVTVALVHPVETFWLLWGPSDRTGLQRDQAEEDFSHGVEWLLSGLVDFDFLSESLMPELCPRGGFPLRVGAMAYTTVIVPNCLTLRESTRERLDAFRKEGGRLLFLGNVPSRQEGEPSEDIIRWAGLSPLIPMKRQSLLEALEGERFLDVLHGDGVFLRTGIRAGQLVHQIRRDGENLWVFIARACPGKGRPDRPDPLIFRFRGEFSVTLYDTLTGEKKCLPAEYGPGETRVGDDLYAQESRLFFLEPGRRPPEHNAEILRKGNPVFLFDLPEPVSFHNSEPNVLLLDRAAFSLDGEPFDGPEEILRLDNRLRDRLGLPRRQDHMLQPWARDRGAIDSHSLTLRYIIESEGEWDPCLLALEKPGEVRIIWNGREIPPNPCGFFTDKSIGTVPLPRVGKGVNELMLIRPFGESHDTEWSYLLGGFGVRLAGSHARLVPLPAVPRHGDLTVQGYPFYGGNGRYDYRFILDEALGEGVLELPHFSGPLCSVELDGIPVGRVAFAPFRISLGPLDPGEHSLGITLFGDRFNSFGTLHNADPRFEWYGPDSYRTEEWQWTDSYLVRPWGILSAPRLYRVS